jgi:hypothetical protein
VSRKLGYYVYLLVNPLDGKVFYVGKGKGKRALSHLDDVRESNKTQIIKEIRAQKQQPRVEILAHGLRDERTALRIETAAIDLLGISNLTNAVRGWRGGELGRMPLSELAAFYEKKPVEIREPAVLIRINRLYRYSMPGSELYDATRGVWKVGRRRRELARYAFAVYEGIVREVYAISKWLPAGSTYSVRNPHGVRTRGRSEFVGTLADDKLRRKYRDKYVGHYFLSGAQNPITYVNVE